MRFLDKELWVKPFGTGMSCIDTIHGECLRGLSLEECAKVCNQSPFCHAGYRVSFDHLPLASYCLPLNTTIYRNSNFLDNLIPANNSTRLSADDGVRVEVFYDPERFPDDVNLEHQPFIFHGDTVFLGSMRPGKALTYLQSDFTFDEEKGSALRLTIGDAVSPIFDFDIRINRDSKIHLFEGNSLSILSHNNVKQAWEFVPYDRLALSFHFRDVIGPFVDYGTTFRLVSSDNHQFLSEDADGALTLVASQPVETLVFIYDASNIVNRSVRTGWKNRVSSDSNAFQKTMESFLCYNYPNCKTRETQSLEPKWRFPVMIAAIIGMIVVGIAIGIALLFQK